MNIDNYIKHWAKQILKESEELDEHIGISYNRDYDWTKPDTTKTTTKDAPDYSGESNEKRGKLECAAMLLNNIVNAVHSSGSSDRYVDMLKQKYDYDSLIDDKPVYQSDDINTADGLNHYIMVNNFFFYFLDNFSTEVETMLLPSQSEVNWSKKGEDERACIKDLVFQLSKQIKVKYGMYMGDYNSSAVVTLQPGTYTIESQFYKTKHTIKIIIKCKESDSYFYGGVLTELLTSDWVRNRKITAGNRDLAKMLLSGKHDIDLSKLPKDFMDRINQAASNLNFFIQQPEKKPNLPNESEEINEDEKQPGKIRMLFRTKEHIDDNAGEIVFDDINSMVKFIESVGGDYSSEIADGFTQGKLMEIDLKTPIIQLVIQQPKG